MVELHARDARARAVLNDRAGMTGAVVLPFSNFGVQCSLLEEHVRKRLAFLGVLAEGRGLCFPTRQMDGRREVLQGREKLFTCTIKMLQ